MVTGTRWPIASTYDNFCELICHILAFCLNSVAIGTAEMSHITAIVNPTILLPIWASELLNIRLSRDKVTRSQDAETLRLDPDFSSNGWKRPCHGEGENP